MSVERAYTKKQWFWAVNLIGLLGALGFCVPAALGGHLLQALILFPYALVVALIIAWVFVAWPLTFAMRKPATWLRAALWGGGVATFIALIGFVFAHWRRLKAQSNPNYNYQLGGGDFVRDVDGVLTPYGWSVVVQNNLLFIAFGIAIGLIARAIIGPGRPIL